MTPEELAQQQTIMRNFSAVLKQVLPASIGFFFCVFEFSDTSGRANYMSNGKRDDMVKMLRETADRLERRQDEGSTKF